MGRIGRARQAGARDAAAPSRRAALAMLLCAPPHAARAAGETQPFRVALSETVVGEFNVNDARAAMLVWVRRMSQELNIPVQLNPNVFESSERIEGLVRNGQLDTIVGNIFEYRQMFDWLDQNQVMVPSDGTSLEYVLLVRGERGPEKLVDLRGCRLVTLRNPAMCAATAWLSTLLPSPRGIEDHFGSVSVESKPARVMLPVFFGQADVCLTTRRSFVTMSELNPQVGKRLRTIATSPEVVATLYMFRKGYTGRTRDLLVRAMEDIRSTAAGRQVLTMFQIESLALRDTRCLAGSLEILAQADRIRARRNAKGAGA